MTSRRTSSSPQAPWAKSPAKSRIPFEFVLDALADLDPLTRPLFGCTAVYIGNKIMFILREKKVATDDNGVWLATSVERHGPLRREFPNMRSVSVLGEGLTGWQNLPDTSPDFEESVMRACELVRERSPLIGNIPKERKSRRRVE